MAKYFMTEFAQRVGVHSNTIKRWESEGVLCPERVGQMRIFTDRDLLRAQAHRRRRANGANVLPEANEQE